MNEKQINDLENEESGFLIKEKGLLLEILYLMKDFFLITSLKVNEKEKLEIKFDNGQIFEVTVEEVK